MAVGQVQEHCETSRAFHERADRAPVVSAGDQVTLPVARYGTIPDLGRTLGDHGHRVAEPGGSAIRLALWLTFDVSVSQVLEFEFAFGLDVDGLVDGLVACAHAVIIGPGQDEQVFDLLGIPVLLQAVADGRVESGVGWHLASFGPFQSSGGFLLGAVRLVQAGLGVAVAPYLAAHGAWQPSDRALWRGYHDRDGAGRRYATAPPSRDSGRR